MNTHSNALDQLGGISTKMLESYEIFAKNHHLNGNELAILYALWVYQARTQKQIADEYLIAKQTINTLCKKYETDGMIESVASDSDKREKILHLTERGQNFAKPIIETLLNQENKIIDEFGAERMSFLLNEFIQLQQLMAQTLEQ